MDGGRFVISFGDRSFDRIRRLQLVGLKTFRANWPNEGVRCPRLKRQICTGARRSGWRDQRHFYIGLDTQNISWSDGDRHVFECHKVSKSNEVHIRQLTDSG